jgi:extradiol dioxygenase family protein
MKDPRFHLTFPTHDVAVAKRFYANGLACTLGQSSMPTIKKIHTADLPLGPISLRQLRAS